VSAIVRGVTVQLTINSVAEGFYTYDGETVTMVKRDSSPVLLDNEPVTEKSHPDHVTLTARRLTRQIRKALLGDAVPGFEKRRLDYTHEGIA
jgi:hypothetical protein